MTITVVSTQASGMIVISVATVTKMVAKLFFTVRTPLGRRKASGVSAVGALMTPPLALR